jgi:hypothetical protein
VARRYCPGWGLGDEMAEMAGWQSMKRCTLVSLYTNRPLSDLERIRRRNFEEIFL